MSPMISNSNNLDFSNDKFERELLKEKKRLELLEKKKNKKMP